MEGIWIALITTVFAGVGLKIAEHFLSRPRERVDEASKFRDELRIQIDNQREEIKELETGLERWRSEYYDLRDKYNKLQLELTLALERLKEEAKQIPPPPDVNI
jgi:chromosome segregation ATPase